MLSPRSEGLKFRYRGQGIEKNLENIKLIIGKENRETKVEPDKDISIGEIRRSV